MPLPYRSKHMPASCTSPQALYVALPLCIEAIWLQFMEPSAESQCLLQWTSLWVPWDKAATLLHKVSLHTVTKLQKRGTDPVGSSLLLHFQELIGQFAGANVDSIAADAIQCSSLLNSQESVRFSLGPLQWFPDPLSVLGPGDKLHTLPPSSMPCSLVP